MKLCCQVNETFVCKKCNDTFCVDCWMLINKAYFELEGGYPIEECLCPSDELERHVVVTTRDNSEFESRWAEVMDAERIKGNEFWEHEDLWKRAAQRKK